MTWHNNVSAGRCRIPESNYFPETGAQSKYRSIIGRHPADDSVVLAWFRRHGRRSVDSTLGRSSDYSKFSS